MIKDDLLPNAIRTGVNTALFKSGDITDHILEEIIGSVGVKAERMYQYANQGRYAHGLPNANISTAATGQDQVQTVLESLEGAPVTLEYCRYGPPNSLHLTWMRLIADHGYDLATNQLTNLSSTVGRPVYLQDMQVVVPATQLNQYQPGSLDQYGPAPQGGYTPWRKSMGTLGSLVQHSPVFSDDLATEDYVRVEYVFGQGAQASEHLNEALVGAFNLPVNDFDAEADFFHVRYTVGGVTKLWMYQLGTGTHPSLDMLHGNGEFTMGTFFPFAYFRFNKTSEIENKATESYKTSKRLVKYLGMNYDQVAEAIDENPDIADVEQAMLIMAVPANTTNPKEQRYLFDFFNGLYQASGTGQSSITQAAIQTAFSSPDFTKSTIVIQDKRFKMALSNGGIYKRRKAGSIGKVGDCTSEMGTTQMAVTRVSEDGGEGGGGGSSYTYNTAVKTHIYRRQVSHYQYDEIEVVALKMLYHVYGHYTVTADEEDDTLLIPLDHSITEDYSIPDREELYSRSLHFIFNSVVITKLKWYQTGLFQFIMIVVAIVITIVSLGSDGGSALGAALAAGNYVAAAILILQQIAISLVIQVAMKLFVKLVGPELAMVFAVVAALYGAYEVFQAGSLAGAPWAAELIQMANGLVKTAQAELFTDLSTEFQEFNVMAQERNKELEAARRLLEGNNRLDPFVFLGEKPEDFYNRTVHSGNVGAMGISAISSYVDIALTLPKINDTLGGITT